MMDLYWTVKLEGNLPELMNPPNQFEKVTLSKSQFSKAEAMHIPCDGGYIPKADNNYSICIPVWLTLQQTYCQPILLL